MTKATVHKIQRRKQTIQTIEHVMVQIMKVTIIVDTI